MSLSAANLWILEQRTNEAESFAPGEALLEQFMEFWKSFRCFRSDYIPRRQNA